MKRGLGCIFRLFLLLITLIIVVFFIVYAVAPVYEFPAPTPFSGKVINNPYHKLDTALWRKGNFQVQSKVWMGLTDGRKNEAKAIYAVYHQLDYDVVAITDYMKINRFEKDKEGYISAYEHGYGLWKTHQVCLGTNHITWLDYPFYQTLSHKQHILNTLKRHCEVLAIVHPKVRNGYDLNDMKFLSNYDLLEALSHYAISLNYWDLALSSGHPVYIISNDDSHDVLDPTKVGRLLQKFDYKRLSRNRLCQNFT
jgi:hypothetical protein